MENKMKWQPIKTAPKNGSNILLLEIPRYPKDDEDYSYEYETHIQVGFWGREYDDEDKSWLCISKDDERIRVFQTLIPTHWMPLPEPPNGE